MDGERFSFSLNKHANYSHRPAIGSCFSNLYEIVDALKNVATDFPTDFQRATQNRNLRTKWSRLVEISDRSISIYKIMFGLVGKTVRWRARSFSVRWPQTIHRVSLLLYFYIESLQLFATCQPYESYDIHLNFEIRWKNKIEMICWRHRRHSLPRIRYVRGIFRSKYEWKRPHLVSQSLRVYPLITTMGHILNENLFSHFDVKLRYTQ